MNEILNHVKQFLSKIDYSPRNRGMRIVYFVLFLAAIFSGLNVHTSKMRIESEINYATLHFTQKEPNLMRSIVRNCEGDIGNELVVKACVDNAKEATLKPLQRELLKYRVLTFIWIAFWVIMSACFIILSTEKTETQKLNLYQIANRFLNQNKIESRFANLYKTAMRFISKKD